MLTFFFFFFLLTVKPGIRYRELGNIIQKHAQANGFSVVRSYCGHGIHRLFHTAPNVPHYASEWSHYLPAYRSSISESYCWISYMFSCTRMISISFLSQKTKQLELWSLAMCSPLSPWYVKVSVTAFCMNHVNNNKDNKLWR